MSAECLKCGSRCCRYFCFEIDVPTDYEEFEDLRWYLCHEGVTIHVDEGDWYISIANSCKMLGEDGRCMIYENRPLICRKYSMSNCDFTEGGYDYEHEFKSPEELDAYARKELGEKEYEKQKKAAYKKIEKLEKKLVSK